MRPRPAPRSAPCIAAAVMLVAVEDILGHVTPVGYVGAVLLAFAAALFCVARISGYARQRDMLEGRAVFVGGLGAVVVLADAAASFAAHSRFRAIVAFIAALAVVAQMWALRRQRRKEHARADEADVDKPDSSTEG